MRLDTRACNRKLILKEKSFNPFRMLKFITFIMLPIKFVTNIRAANRKLYNNVRIFITVTLYILMQNISEKK